MILPDQTRYRILSLCNDVLMACDHEWRSPGALRERANIAADPASQSASRGALEILWAEGMIERRLEKVRSNPIAPAELHVFFRAKAVITV